MRNIHVIMTREADGGEEGNQWEFAGTDEELYDLFALLCQVIIYYPKVVLPHPEEK